MRKKQKTSRSQALVIQDGALLMRIGVVMDACCTGLHMLPSTAEAAGFKAGDYLQLDHVERDTCVVRRLVHCSECPGMRRDYVYIDTQTAHYLSTDLHERVRVKQADYPMEMP
jgi:hypothetical protein